MALTDQDLIPGDLRFEIFEMKMMKAHGLHMVCTWCDYVRPCSTAAGPSFALGFLGPEVSKLDEKWWETSETAMVSRATSHGALERLLVALVVPTSANFRCCIPKVPEVAETRKVQCKLFLSVSFSFLPFLHYKILQSCNAGNCWGTCSCKTIQHGNQKHPKSIITKTSKTWIGMLNIAQLSSTDPNVHAASGSCCAVNAVNASWSPA